MTSKSYLLLQGADPALMGDPIQAANSKRFDFPAMFYMRDWTFFVMAEMAAMFPRAQKLLENYK